MIFIKGKAKPPADEETEKRVLGCILLDHQQSQAAFAELNEEDFFHGAHQILFRILAQMNYGGEKIDLTTVTSKVSALDNAGGKDYPVKLMESVASVSNLDAYIKILQEKSALRKIAYTAERTVQAAYENQESHRILSDLTEFIVKMNSKQQDLVPIQRVMKEEIARISDRLQVKKPQGIPCGLHFIDDIHFGLQPYVYIIAGRPHTGKTELALRMADYIADQHPVLFCSLEMRPRELMMRSLQHVTQLNWKSLYSLMDAKTYQKFQEGVRRLESRRLWYLNLRRCTLYSFCTTLLAVYHRLKPAVIFIDYLQLLSVQNQSEYAALSEISITLHDLQARLGVPFVILSQVSRMKNDKRVEEFKTTKPIRIYMQDLRGSGRIEENADCVIGINSPGSIPEGQTCIQIELEMLKNRLWGGRGCWHFNYDMSTGTFTPIFSEPIVPLKPKHKDADSGKQEKQKLWYEQEDETPF